MLFPFRVGVDDRQKQADKDHIVSFYEATQVEHTYKNKAGDTRKVIRVFLPRGCQTELTVFEHRKNGTFYHTPLATEDGDFKGRVIYETGDKKTKSCDSVEWMKWAKGGDVEHTPNAAPEANPAKAAMMKIAKQLAGGEEKSNLGKDAEWVSAQQIKKEQKKSSKKSS
jgi:hypothetical protein